MTLRSKEFLGDLKLVRRIFKLLSNRERVLVSLTLFVRFCLVSLDLIGIFLIGAVVSYLSGTTISEKSNFGLILQWLKSQGVENGYAIVLGVALLFFIAKGLISVGLNRATAMYLARVEWMKAVQVFSTLVEQPLEQLETLSKQELIFATTQSVTSAITRAILVGSTVISEVSLLLAISIYLALTDFILFLFIASFFGLVAVVMNIFVTRAAGRAAHRMHKVNLESQGTVLDLVGGFRQLALSPNRGTLVGRFSKARQDFASQSAEYQVITNLPRYITEIAVMLGVGLLVSLRATGDSSMASASVIAVFLAGIFRIVSSMIPLQSALSGWKTIEFEAPAALTVLENSTKTLQKQTHQPIEIIDGPLNLEVRNLSYRHVGESSNSLQDLSFNVSPGKFLAIVGKSGSGKSTLADLILGLRQPTNGSIELSGIPVREFSRMHPGRLGYVPQNPLIFNATLRQNISLDFSENKYEDERILQAAKKSGLLDFIMRLPLGLDTFLGDSARETSGGEIQRISLARSLFLSPGLLVLDEATSALDKNTQSEIIETLEKLKDQVTLIVIAHREETIRSADAVLQFDDEKPGKAILIQK